MQAKQLTPGHISIKVNGNSQQSPDDQHKSIKAHPVIEQTAYMDA
jgi:hypothetical protein